MFIDKYGLTNSKPKEEGAENSLLWTLQTILLEDHQEPRIQVLMDSIEKCRVGQGLYAQNPSHVTQGIISTTHGKDAYMSPDQLIVITMSSYLYGKTHHLDVLNEIKKQGFIKYNNLKDDKDRFIHPRDLCLYYTLVYNKLAFLFLIPLLISCVISCLKKKEDTSGKLLVWTKCVMLKDKFIIMKIAYKLCSLIIKKEHKDWAEVFEIYFPHRDHPNRLLAVGNYRDY